ncbi:hypothetical protein ALP75_200965 [Pseudomonas syringae pv. actinidiae]|nr:hypothetical protein ALP75_200965 [Pseudomonas syringae pv. actinidiae]
MKSAVLIFRPGTIASNDGAASTGSRAATMTSFCTAGEGRSLRNLAAQYAPLLWPSNTMLRALFCCAKLIALSIRAKISSAWALLRSSSAAAFAVAAAARASAAGSGAFAATSFGASLGLAAFASPAEASGSRGNSVLSCASGRVMLRLDQPTSGNLRRSGPTVSGQSGDSASPGRMMTAPCGASVFAGFHSARKLSSPACSCC